MSRETGQSHAAKWVTSDGRVPRVECPVVGFSLTARYKGGVITSILLTLAAVGWLTSVIGAVLQHLGSARLTTHPTDGSFTISTYEGRSRWGLTMIVLGASAGGAGTIVAVLTSQ